MLTYIVSPAITDYGRAIIAAHKKVADLPEMVNYEVGDIAKSYRRCISYALVTAASGWSPQYPNADHASNIKALADLAGLLCWSRERSLSHDERRYLELMDGFPFVYQN